MAEVDTVAVSVTGSGDTLARDAAAVEALRLIEGQLSQGDAQGALAQFQSLVADDATPPWRAADLCRLGAQAARALCMLPLAETLWHQAALRSLSADAAADAHVERAVLLAALGRRDDAVIACGDAIERVPAHALARANRALLWADVGRRADAEADYRVALEADPENATTHTQLGVLLDALGRRDEAETEHRRALVLEPANASAHTHLALVLQSLGRLDEAERHQREALALAPHRPQIHTNLGHLLAERGDVVGAESALREALALDAQAAVSHANLGVFFADLQRDAEAEPHFQQALAQRPDDTQTQTNLGRLLLAQGRWREGWGLFESRYRPGAAGSDLSLPNLDAPAWHGEPLAGRSVLVWPEEGLGDQIQFCRYASRLKALGAGAVTLVCQRPLHRLFGTLANVDAVVAADVAGNAFRVADGGLPDHALWTTPPRIAAHLRCGPEESGATVPYLFADPSLVPRWRQRAAACPSGARLRVGLVWRGNPRHQNDAERSMPGLDTLAPLWSVPGVQFISLQTGERATAELPADAPPTGAWGADLTDFADTAAALEAIDLLVCVDTAIAHLSGAMGRPCWVLLPHHRTDWRWQRGRDDTPWYPRGMRLFRQPRRGDWAALVERVRGVLAEHVKAGAP